VWHTERLERHTLRITAPHAERYRIRDLCLNRMTSVRNSRRLIALAALLALGSAQAPSHDALHLQDAQDADTTADVRCLIVGTVVIDRDPSKQAAAMMLAMYYIGRIEGRAPTADLELC
jgi:hypothetical protein